MNSSEPGCLGKSSALYRRNKSTRDSKGPDHEAVS